MIDKDFAKNNAKKKNIFTTKGGKKKFGVDLFAAVVISRKFHLKEKWNKF